MHLHKQQLQQTNWQVTNVGMSQNPVPANIKIAKLECMFIQCIHRTLARVLNTFDPCPYVYNVNKKINGFRQWHSIEATKSTGHQTRRELENPISQYRKRTPPTPHSLP